MKTFSRILLFVLAFAMLATMAVSAKGDVNADGSINDADVKAIIEHIANNGNYISVYDIRPDSEAVINILDAVALKAQIDGVVLPADDNWTSYWY